jgi:hypothetical protein
MLSEEENYRSMFVACSNIELTTLVFIYADPLFPVDIETAAAFAQGARLEAVIAAPASFSVDTAQAIRWFSATSVTGS